MNNVNITAENSVVIEKNEGMVIQGSDTHKLPPEDRDLLLVQLSQLQEALSSLVVENDLVPPKENLLESVQELKEEIGKDRSISEQRITKFKSAVEALSNGAKAIKNVHEIVPILTYYATPVIGMFFK